MHNIQVFVHNQDIPKNKYIEKETLSPGIHLGRNQKKNAINLQE